MGFGLSAWGSATLSVLCQLASTHFSPKPLLAIQHGCLQLLHYREAETKAESLCAPPCTSAARCP